MGYMLGNNINAEGQMWDAVNQNTLNQSDSLVVGLYYQTRMVLIYNCLHHQDHKWDHHSADDLQRPSLRSCFDLPNGYLYFVYPQTYVEPFGTYQNYQ